MYGTSLPGFRQNSAHICRSCLTSLVRSSLTPKTQRRWIGLKYIEKQKAAAEEWSLRAEQIKAGTQRNLWDIFEERGYVKDVAGQHDAIREIMRCSRIQAYVGIDPTAESLHIGHLVPLMPLFWMYLHGYGATTLIGGATAKIGDPTDRLQSRERLDRTTQTKNMTKIHYQLKRIWLNVEEQARRHGYKKTWAWRRAVVNNNTWWNKLPMLEVLRRVGDAMRVGPMLSRDTVKRKMTEGNGVSFAEFSYPIMQGWDWWQLFSVHNCQMQIGGSDQYGNIISGIEVVKAARDSETNPAEKLIRKSEHDDPIGFTVPLLTDSSGAKFGKSAGNAVWLDQYLTSTFDLYGYFVRRPDADVENLLNMFTFLPTEVIKEKMAEHNADPSKRVAQHTLAYEVMCLVHGEAKAKETKAEHAAMYGKGSKETSSIPTIADYASHSENEPWTANTAPRVDMILPESLIMGKSIAAILYASGLATSKADGMRIAVQKAAYVGGAPGQKASVNKGMSSSQVEFTPVVVWHPNDTKNFLIDGKVLILRKGKHNVRFIEMVSDEEYEKSGQSYPGQPYAGKLRRLKKELEELENNIDASTSNKEAGISRSEMKDRLARLRKDFTTESASESSNDQAMEFPRRQNSETQQKFEARVDAIEEKISEGERG